MKRKNFILILTILIVVLVASIITRVVLLRQSDNDYASLVQTISKAEDAKDAANTSVSSIAFPIFITDKFFTTYSQQATTLSQAFDTISKDPLVKSDTTLKTTYEKYKDTLQSYVTSNNNLVDSIKHYFAVSKACRTMGYDLDTLQSQGQITATAFATKSKDCQDAIKTADTSPDKLFNDQFFYAYLDNSSALVKAYSQEADAKGSASSKASVETAWNNLQVMNNAMLNLKRSPDPTDALNALSKVTAQQQGNFFR